MTAQVGVCSGTTVGGPPIATGRAPTPAAAPDSERDAAAPAAPETGTEPRATRTAGLQELLDMAGWVLAPASLVTGALYWAGFNRNRGFWETFGVDQALLQYSTTDYMVRAVDTVFPLFVVVATGTLVARQFHHVVIRRLCTSSRMWCVQALKWALLVLGAASLMVTAAQLFPAFFYWLDPLLIRDRSPLLPPSLGLAGTAAMGYAVYLSGDHEFAADGSIRLPRLSRIPLALLSVLMVLWMFWAAEQWGQLRGAEDASDDPGFPTVIYSATPLQLSGYGITPLPVAPSEGGYRYGYAGLRLLRYSKDRYFLLTPQPHRVVVLKESDQLRFEFERPRDGSGGPTPMRASVHVDVE